MLLLQEPQDAARARHRRSHTRRAQFPQKAREPWTIAFSSALGPRGQGPDHLPSGLGMGG